MPKTRDYDSRRPKEGLQVEKTSKEKKEEGEFTYIKVSRHESKEIRYIRVGNTEVST